MYLDELPDDNLLQIFSKCNVEDIDSLRLSNRRLLYHINNYRLHYSKKSVYSLDITIEEDGQSKVVVQKCMLNSRKKIIFGLHNNVIKSLNPLLLISQDHDELANMSRLWWKERQIISLSKTIDYRRYLPHFEGCTVISLDSDSPKNLTEILHFIKTKRLKYFYLIGDGKLECTDDDLRKIGKIADKMRILKLRNVSESSHISIDGVLDMIETGSSFERGSSIFISRIEHFENIDECLSRRSWIFRSEKRARNFLELWTTNNVSFKIETD